MPDSHVCQICMSNLHVVFACQICTGHIRMSNLHRLYLHVKFTCQICTGHIRMSNLHTSGFHVSFAHMSDVHVRFAHVVFACCIYMLCLHITFVVYLEKFYINNSKYWVQINPNKLLYMQWIFWALVHCDYFINHIDFCLSPKSW